jgi:hypothetical protein
MCLVRRTCYHTGQASPRERKGAVLAGNFLSDLLVPAKIPKKAG